MKYKMLCRIVTKKTQTSLKTTLYNKPEFYFYDNRFENINTISKYKIRGKNCFGGSDECQRFISYYKFSTLLIASETSTRI